MRCHAPEAKPTWAYALDEIKRILSILPEPARTAFAVASFSGLRRGEIEGLEWRDIREGHIFVTRSIWSGITSPPKTQKSAAPVPLIPQLAQRLEMFRLACGSPTEGPVFRTSLGTPMSLNNLTNRDVFPVMRRCGVCGFPPGKPHLKQDHDWQRDITIPEWRGWHACRRGLASNLFALGISDILVQRILRHSNVQVTQQYYIKPRDEAAIATMNTLGNALPDDFFGTRDSDGTVNGLSASLSDKVQ